MEQGNAEQTPSAGGPRANQTQQPAPPVNTPPTKKPLIIAGILIGFVLFGVGGFYVGTLQPDERGDLVSDTTISNISEDVSFKSTPEDVDSLCGVEKTRLLEPMEIGDTKYYIYQRNSMNIVIRDSKNYLDSGAFTVKNNQEESCEELIDIWDENLPKNNIYEIYVDGNNIYALIIDHLGAGSGEGGAKIMRSSNNGDTWSLDYCFYYTPEEWLSIKEFLLDNPEKLSLEESYECRNFILGQKEAGVSSWAEYHSE